MSGHILLSTWASGLPNFFPSTVTFYSATETKSGSLERKKVWDQPLAGFTDHACRVAPTSGGKVKTAAETFVQSDYTLSLPADATTVKETMRAVVTGPNAGTYEVMLVQVGSEGVLSRVYLHTVR